MITGMSEVPREFLAIVETEQPVQARALGMKSILV